jgi:hypothetical protein
MIRVTANAHYPIIFDMGEHATGIWAVFWADGFNYFCCHQFQFSIWRYFNLCPGANNRL